MAEEAASLFDRLGGDGAVMAAVDIFYSKLLADPVTKPFFDEIDMAGQARKQVAFMAWAFGGPDEYRGRDLRESHRNLVRNRGLTDVHFDAVAGHLASTLEELDIPEELAAEALALVAGTRNEVLDR